MRSHPKLEITPASAPPGAGADAHPAHPQAWLRKLLGSEQRARGPGVQEQGQEKQGLQAEGEGPGGRYREAKTQAETEDRAGVGKRRGGSRKRRAPSARPGRGPGRPLTL